MQTFYYIKRLLSKLKIQLAYQTDSALRIDAIQELIDVLLEDLPKIIKRLKIQSITEL